LEIVGGLVECFGNGYIFIFIFRDNNDEFGIDFENIMEEGAANGMNDDLDDAADDDD